MELSLRRWKPGQLLLGWGAYWAGLVGIALGPAIRASWHATRLPDGHGSINASVNNGTLSYEVIEEGAKTFMGTVPLSTAILWIVGPPLILWLVWLIVRERPSPRAGTVAGRSADALPAGSQPAAEVRVRQDDRVPMEPGRVRTPNP
jgi:hypothetical protein